MNIRRFIIPAMTLPLAGCVNVEHNGKPRDWPPLARVASTGDLRGVYENDGSGTGGRRLGHLWFCLTREGPLEVRGARLRIDARDDRHLRASLITKRGDVLRTRELTTPADFQIANGAVRLPVDFTSSAQEAFKWGVGVGGSSCALHKAADGSLVGEMRGGGVAIALFVPMVGFGDLWEHWEKIP